MADAATVTSSPFTGTLDDAFGDSKSAIDDIIAKSEASRVELKSKTAPLIESIGKSRESASALTPPKLPEIPAAPVAEQRNPIEAFGSLASILAIFGSGMTRAPMTNALNAAAGVMNAWRAQDADKAQKQFAVWKANIDNAKTLFDWQQSNYTNALKKIDTDTDGALKEIQALAAVYKDDVTAQLAATKQIDALFKNQQTMQRTFGDMITKQDDLIKLQNFRVWESQNPNATLEQRAEATSRFLGGGAFTPEMSEAALNLAADALMKGDPTLVQGLGRSGTNKVKFLNALAARMDEKGVPEDQRGEFMANAKAAFEGRKAAERAVGTRTANLELAANELLPMLQITRDAAVKVPRTQFVPVNKAIQYFNTQTGSPEQRAFGFAVNTLVNVYTRAIRPSGVPTDADKEHAREMLITADSPAAFEAALKMMEAELGAAKKAPGMTREDIQRIYGGQGAVAPAQTVPLKSGKKAQTGFESPEYLAPPAAPTGQAEMEPIPQSTSPLGGVATPGTQPQQAYQLPANPTMLVEGRRYNTPKGVLIYKNGKFYTVQ
jgi:hypothetical protein